MMQTVAWIAAVLVFTTFYVRDAIAMRALAVLANLSFITFALLGLQDGVFDKVLPILVLHVCSLILNTTRLREEIAKRCVPSGIQWLFRQYAGTSLPRGS